MDASSCTHYNPAMAQTKAGARKIAAQMLGIPLEEYEAHLELGEKWCGNCRRWQARSEFGRDKWRGDGLTAECSASRNRHAKVQYTPRERERGRSFTPARDGDKLQARRRINYFVEAGLLPHPNEVPARTVPTSGNRASADTSTTTTSATPPSITSTSKSVCSALSSPIREDRDRNGDKD